ncbi:hypothetical protein BC830DRAFT_310692 [Chytriomyces sp. MP71]|nr:hypothetical protein BC830DRAFT_310692 [Chytriomyces sp. MP71]
MKERVGIYHVEAAAGEKAPLDVLDKEISSGASGIGSSKVKVWWSMGALGNVKFLGDPTVKDVIAFVEPFLRPPAIAFQADAMTTSLNGLDVAFVFAYDPKVTNDSQLMNFLDIAASVQTRVAVFITPDLATLPKLQIHPNFVKLPLLVKVTNSGSGNHETCNLDMANLVLQKRNIQSWILDRRIPLLRALTDTNAVEIMGTTLFAGQTRKLVVLGILNGTQAPTELQSVAQDWAAQKRGGGATVLFTWIEYETRRAYVDKAFGGVLDPVGLWPRYLIVDPVAGLAHASDQYGRMLEARSIGETVEAVISGKLKGKRLKRSWIRSLLTQVFMTTPYLFLVLFVAIGVWSLNRRTQTHFQLPVTSSKTQKGD